ncbi:MAG TPA: 4-(cytidine 5'-diphospho)-2-C-methyl-D-erythritol kinase [Tissierellaceae bacterium]
MENIAINSYAKINLALDIIGKREDGYHEIKTIMQSIDLKDKLLIENIDKNEIIVNCNHPGVPLDENNLVYKSWEIMKETAKVEKGIKVTIDKNIPMGAGLAGGSSNAGAVLKGLNELWDVGLTKEELIDLGKGIGADVPFTILGGTALAEGVGEKLTSLKSFRNKHVLICNPGIEISSKYAYSILKIDDERVDVEKIIKAMENEDLELIGKLSRNKMEDEIFKKYEIIERIKLDLINSNAKVSLMSGSGSSVFGIFEDEESMNKAKEKVEKYAKFVVKTKTI